jgi:hypothetical protein
VPDRHALVLPLLAVLVYLILHFINNAAAPLALL